jgi:hypothetical protein
VEENMIGLLLMIAVSALVAWLASLLLGTIGGIIVGILFSFLWFQFNKWHRTFGLYRANLFSYFAFRKAGRNVGEALKSMAEARYRFSKKSLNTVLLLFSDIPESESDQARVTQAVFSVFCLENGLPPNPERYISKIRQLYSKISRNHGIS